MKILLVSGVYPPHIGGPSAQTHQLAKGLILRGVDVQVVTFGETPGQALVEGVVVHFLNGSTRRNWKEKVTKNWLVFQELCKIIQDFQPNVVHQQTAVANLALYTGLASRRYSIPNLLKYSSDLRWERLRQRPKNSELSQAENWVERFSRLGLTRLQQLLFFLFDRIWVTTPPFQAQLHQHFKVAKERIILLPNFIDLSLFEEVALGQARKTCGSNNPSQQNFVVVVVSRLQPWKGVDICIQAIAKLRDLPIQLRIVGDGQPEYEAYLQNLVQTLQLSTQVEFAGQISPHDIHMQYSQADLFVLASTYEPFGIVLIEAMAAGVPIVATGVGGIPSVVEDTAILVPPNQVSALAQGIRDLLVDPEKSASLISKGRQRARTFGLEQGIDRLLEVYDQLAQ